MENRSDPRIEKFLGDFEKLLVPEGELPSFTQIYIGEELISSESNLVQSTNISSFHSEMLAIQKAQELGSSRYLNHTLLITSLEPCLQCAGAIIQARIPEVWYLAEQTKAPGISSIDVDFLYKLNHFPRLKFWRHPKMEGKWRDFFLGKRGRQLC